MMTNVIEIDAIQTDCDGCVYRARKQCEEMACVPELRSDLRDVIYVYADAAISIPATVTYPRDSEGTY